MRCIYAYIFQDDLSLRYSLQRNNYFSTPFILILIYILVLGERDGMIDTTAATNVTIQWFVLQYF